MASPALSHLSLAQRSWSVVCPNELAQVLDAPCAVEPLQRRAIEFGVSPNVGKHLFSQPVTVVVLVPSCAGREVAGIAFGDAELLEFQSVRG